MKTKIIELKENYQIGIEEAGQIIRDGGVVAFPTETVYGLGADALNVSAVEKIFKAKGRPQDNPLIVHIADLHDIKPLVKCIPDIANKFMEKFWPGPLTLILEKSDLIPDITSAGLKTIGIRMPSNNVAEDFIRASKRPIAAPSANISGRPSPTTMESCVEDLNEKVECIIGGENSEVGVESTIVDCTVYPPCVLRPGGITLEMLKQVEEKTYIDSAIMEKPKKNFTPKAPGMKYRHYAPKAPVKIIDGDLQKTIEKINEIVQNYIDDKKVGIMATEETKNLYQGGVVVSLGSRKNPEEIAKNLFSVLRSFDNTDVEVIYAEAFEEKEIGVAIMNRLKKAAGFNIERI
ncbi:L-threonylcarbamoyladenylate synthase [Haloimpatiens lingqiaonensis]|uniref:L-threonylcarbamoyladenylate synthase n=1 Tax=Haloimpatiens lingqiaonensis TaxID=1380675 RepID=UPI0010FE19AB|nr:L-threonylcarbamoyladenylate synthase [Haloimpatiens lingqiaonensis]